MELINIEVLTIANEVFVWAPRTAGTCIGMYVARALHYGFVVVL